MIGLVVFVLNYIINLIELECIIKIMIKRCKLIHIVLRKPRQELKINLDTGLGILFVTTTNPPYTFIQSNNKLLIVITRLELTGTSPGIWNLDFGLRTLDILSGLRMTQGYKLDYSL